MEELLSGVVETTNPNGPDVPVAVANAGSYLPARYDVDGLAVASVAAAGAALADLIAARNGGDPPWVSIDARSAAAAFVCERLLVAEGWELPPTWDSIAGDYHAAGFWIRLHTNYAAHRDAALGVLGCASEREAVAEAVAGWDADELQEAIVEQGGCAAVLNTPDQWRASEPGGAALTEPLVRIEAREVRAKPKGPSKQPLSGLRVLDLTRVIAGPVATRLLAAYGADVLRIDPPGFAEVGALLPETTAGKRCAALDLAGPRDRDRFAELVAGADVLVSSLRPGALDRLGLGQEELLAVNPSLITARLNAYGWSGPWSDRRGFDSLVQMSTGIAASPEGGAPQPLPAQALDHATGFILAAAIARALARRERERVASDIHCSLVATANLLLASPTPRGAQPARWEDGDLEAAQTEWGPIRRVPMPRPIDGLLPNMEPRPGELGRHPASWR